MAERRSFQVGLAMIVVCTSYISAWGEVVSVDLEIQNGDGITTYWLSPDLHSTNFFTVTGDAAVDLTLQFKTDDYGPTHLSNASIRSSSVAISDFDFGIDVGEEMRYLNTHGLAGHVFGATSNLYGRGAIVGIPPLPERRYFSAANTLGITLDAGEYNLFDSTYEWFTYGSFTEDSPMVTTMNGGEGRIDVALTSVTDGIATYEVEATVPMVFDMWVSLFERIAVGGQVEATGTFTRPVGTPEPLPDNGDFAGGLEGWIAGGGGTAAAVDFNGNQVIELTTGSPATLSQWIDTPESEYLLRFDYLFEQDLGTLDVTLSGETLASIASEGIVGEFRTCSIPVDDPSLIGLSDAELSFIFDGPEGGLKLMLDNVGAPTPVPEPSTFALLAIGVVGLFLRRRQKQEDSID